MGQPGAQGFLDRAPSAYRAADAGDGFIARSERDLNTMDHSWGNVVIPDCYSQIEDPLRAPATLSLWDDLESVAAFSYHGAHGEALTKRKEWFETHELPTYVAWWVEDTQKLDRKEAAARLDHLHQYGPTAHAFNFSRPFDADGNPCALGADKVKAKVARNRQEGC